MAYIRGLEKKADPGQVASVASFFVSRIDTVVEKLWKSPLHPGSGMRGKAAVASAKMVYRRFNEIFYDTPFAKQRGRGAKVQKIVWGSTGTKNPKIFRCSLCGRDYRSGYHQYYSHDHFKRLSRPRQKAVFTGKRGRSRRRP